MLDNKKLEELKDEIYAGDSILNEKKELVYVLKFTDDSALIYNLDENTYSFPKEGKAKEYLEALKEAGLISGDIFDHFNSILEEVKSLQLIDSKIVESFVKEELYLNLTVEKMEENKEEKGLEKLEEAKFQVKSNDYNIFSYDQVKKVDPSLIQDMEITKDQVLVIFTNGKDFVQSSIMGKNDNPANIYSWVEDNLKDWVDILIVEASKETAKCPTCGNDYLKKTGYCLSCKKKVEEEESEDKKDKEDDKEKKEESVEKNEEKTQEKIEEKDLSKEDQDILSQIIAKLKAEEVKDLSDDEIEKALKGTAVAKGLIKKAKQWVKDKILTKDALKEEVSKKLTEGRDGFTIVWVTSSHSVVKSGITDQKSYDRAYEETKKEMKKVADTDDFWIDDIWSDDSDMPKGINWKAVLLPRGQFDEDLFETILDDPDSAIKMQFLSNHGYDLTSDNIEDVYVHNARGESWVEGNFNTKFPEDWLAEQFEMDYPKEKVILDNWSYFEEGVARMYSDNEPNGFAKYDRIGDYFVYSYNV